MLRAGTNVHAHPVLRTRATHSWSLGDSGRIGAYSWYASLRLVGGGGGFGGRRPRVHCFRLGRSCARARAHARPSDAAHDPRNGFSARRAGDGSYFERNARRACVATGSLPSCACGRPLLERPRGCGWGAGRPRAASASARSLPAGIRRGVGGSRVGATPPRRCRLVADFVGEDVLVVGGETVWLCSSAEHGRPCWAAVE